MKDDISDSIADDKNESVSASAFNISIDNKNHFDNERIVLWSLDEGSGNSISLYEYSLHDSPKISKWIFNLMCINDNKKLK